MTKPTGKKRGRPRKVFDWVVRLGEDRSGWNKWLRSVGCPQQLCREKEISEQSLPPRERDTWGRRIRPTRDALGEYVGHESATQRTDPTLHPLLEVADDGSIVLPAVWRRCLEYMNVIAERLSPKDKGAALKRLFLEDARSRSSEPPLEIPAELGTPEELKRRLAWYELEIYLKSNRRDQVIHFVVNQFPPDVEEDLDEADEPKGHWEGLKWFSDSVE